MSTALRIATGIDRLTGWIGRNLRWLVLTMTLLAAFNAVARSLGRATGVDLASNAYLEGQWYLFSLVFLLGAADGLRTDGHVRVDVLYGRLSARARAGIDLAGTVLFLLPVTMTLLWASWPAVSSSWAVREGSPDPGGLPRYPIKALLLLAFALLLLQGISQAIKAVHTLRAGGETEPDPIRA